MLGSIIDTGKHIPGFEFIGDTILSPIKSNIIFDTLMETPLIDRHVICIHLNASPLTILALEDVWSSMTARCKRIHTYCMEFATLDMLRSYRYDVLVVRGTTEYVLLSELLNKQLRSLYTAIRITWATDVRQLIIGGNLTFRSISDQTDIYALAMNN
jgi:hypothetical protein